MKDKKILETIQINNQSYVLIGIFEVIKEKPKPKYVRGGSLPITFLDENSEKYKEHYGVRSLSTLLNYEYNIQSMIDNIIYDDNSILEKYEGVYILEKDYFNTKRSLKKLKSKYVYKTIGLINNDPQFNTILFCLLGIIAIFLVIILSH